MQNKYLNIVYCVLNLIQLQEWAKEYTQIIQQIYKL